MDTVRWLDETEARAWRGYRRMRALVELQLSRELARETGLSMPDYDVLSTVSEAPGQQLRLTELARWLLWSPSRLSHQITRMQQRGLVTRVECEDDGRGSTVALTSAGVRAIEEAAPGHVAAVRRHMIDLLTGDELVSLGELSQRVVAHLTPLVGGGPKDPPPTHLAGPAGD